MDEYRRGLLRQPAQRRLTPSGPASGCASFLPFPPGLRVMVICEEADETLISALTSAGCRVAFTGSDRKEGTRIARATGAQHHPVAPEDNEAIQRSADLLRRNWLGNPDVLIALGTPAPEGIADYLIAVGDCGGIRPSIALPADASVQSILWALLPETRNYILSRK